MSAHALYILAAYGFTIIVVGALIVWALVQHRQHKRTLAALEAKLKRGA